MPSSSVVIVSKCNIYPEHNSAVKSLKLSVSDLPMLSCQYIQKASSPRTHHSPPPTSSPSSSSPSPEPSLTSHLSPAPHLSTAALLPPPDRDIPPAYRKFFQFDNTLSYAGHDKPLAAVQVTELNDAVFVGCTVNHAVVDGTSFWNFFNTFAEMARGAKKISKSPDLPRNRF
ncbi:UNVERIFIED_CONTAM: hypothetical protein Slati_1661000 [Sesamum latifolium]|uniref:Uncharacterized protein n=1 Tax=Sesamum latifolium TaxID=2727402 RepID=A0AAW2XFV5_9LAMI